MSVYTIYILSFNLPVALQYPLFCFDNSVVVLDNRL